MNQNLKIALIVVVVIIVILVAVLVTASAVLGEVYGGWPWHMHDFMWPGMMRGGFMFIMALVWAGVLALIIWAVVTAVQKTGGVDSSTSSSGGNSALEILKERYARGEIDKQEFEENKKDLS